jgi:hypothetical protein
MAMPSDDSIRERFLEVSSAVTPDLPAALGTVQREARRRRTRGRFIWACSVAVGVLLVVALGRLVASELHSSVGPSHVPSAPGGLHVTDPFQVIHTFTPAELGLRHVLSIATAPDGTFYATDRSQSVAHISRDGRVLDRFGGPGTGPGRLRMDSGGIAVDTHGRVYVADSGNARVDVLSGSGRYLRSFGDFGHGLGQLRYPFAVAVGTDGTVYVSDDRAATFTAFAPSGRVLWRLGSTGSPAQIVGHQHFSQVLPAGLLTADDDAGLVDVVNRAGTVVDSWGSETSGVHFSTAYPAAGVLFPHGLCDVTADPDGFEYTNSCQDAPVRHHTTEMFDAQHRLVGALRDGPFAQAPRFWPDGEAVVAGHGGSVFVLRVQRP